MFALKSKTHKIKHPNSTFHWRAVGLGSCQRSHHSKKFPRMLPNLKNRNRSHPYVETLNFLYWKKKKSEKLDITYYGNLRIIKLISHNIYVKVKTLSTSIDSNKVKIFFFFFLSSMVKNGFKHGCSNCDSTNWGNTVIKKTKSTTFSRPISPYW